MTQKREAPTSTWARKYCEKFGLALVSIDPGEKAPKGHGWNQPGGYITDASAAEAFWQRNHRHNLGVVLGPSRVCSLDVDDVEWTRHALRELLGIDLDAMADSNPTVVGNPLRFRVLFRVPDGVDLGRHSLTWPHQEDPDGSKFKGLMAAAKAAKEAGDGAAEAQARAEADKIKRFTVFELRAGLVQDVLPPSIHPGTGKPYTWRTAPDADAGLPVLPQALLAVWLNWDAFKRDALAACPWAPKPAAVVRHPARPAAPPSGGGDVIEQFNRAHDVESLLAAHGYERRGNKWLAPCSSSGLPGVAVTDGRVYSHHASDPLCNDHMNDAFDVFRILEHDGDAKAATKAAAKLLGLDSRPQRQAQPAVRDDAPPLGDDLPGAPSGACDALADAESPPPELAHTHAGGEGVFRIGEQELLLDFVLIYGTDLVWDCNRRRMVKMTALREVVGRERIKLWQESQHRRVAEDVVFDPTLGCSPTMLNLYDGFKMTPDPRARSGCELILAHLWRLCGYRQDEYNFLLRWIAYPLQNPGAKMHSSVVMFGAEGPGKSLVWEKVVKRIYGDYGVTIGQAQLESQFTGWQSRKLFALAEEVVSRQEMRHYKGLLKHLVTGETLQINEKMQSLREEANHLNFVFLSNSTVPLELDDGDRRYLVLYVDKVPPQGYFDNLLAEIADGGTEAFYQYLLELDMTGFSAHTKPPLNEEKNQLIEGSLTPARYFIRIWLRGETDWPVGAVVAGDLYRAFCRWCERANEFKRREREFYQEAMRDMPQVRKDIHYPHDMDKHRTCRIYLPPAMATREQDKAWLTEVGQQCRAFHKSLNDQARSMAA